MRSYAVLSVYDKTGIEQFAKFLTAREVGILSTGGTHESLKKAGIPVQSISEFTEYPEILGGRVKSLHPKIHGGILARRDLREDIHDLERVGTIPIDYVVVNLYPFTQKVREIEERGHSDHESLIELIDIGGPTLLRAAAKNCHYVVPVCDPEDYSRIMEELSGADKLSTVLRQELAEKVFRLTAAYDSSVARYFSLKERILTPKGNRVSLAPTEGIALERVQLLRYGENPHQEAALYRDALSHDEAPLWRQVQGKELSFNNLVDTEAAIDLYLDLEAAFPDECAAVIIKHTNPCGSAVRATNEEAFKTARACDPVSAFGGIIAMGGEISKALAESIIEGFVEVIIAPKFSPEALEVFLTKKNIRLLECNIEGVRQKKKQGMPLPRRFLGDYLLQTSDELAAEISTSSAVCGEVSEKMLTDINFAWCVCKHVKSNAIVIAKDRQAIGVGAGQMSRVDAARLAVQRCLDQGFDPKGAVAASDAFLPFADTLEVLADAGVIALAQPGGSLRDEEVKAKAMERKVAMLFTGERHFRH